MRSVRAVCGAALLVLALASSCGNNKPQGAGTGGKPGTGGDTNPGSGGAGGVGPLKACVDRPGELPRPPADGLPCELIPPGLAP
jgi:hypothetical protein